MGISYVFYLLISLAIFASGIFMAGGKFFYFFDPASMMLILLPSVFLTLINYSPSEIINCFKLAAKNSSGSVKEYKNAELLFCSLRKYIALSAFIAFFMGLVLMLGGVMYVKDPVLFGNGFAAALISVLYSAAIILLVIYPVSNALKKKLNEID